MFDTELSVLTLYGLLVVLTIVAQSTATTLQFGLPYAASARDEGRSATGIAARLVRTVDNSIHAMALFAPAVLVVHLGGKSSEATVLASQVFLVARLLYVIVYPAGVPYLRTLVWVAGFAATAFLYAQAL